MEFNEFPQNFAAQKELEIDEALEKGNEKISEIRAKTEKKAEAAAKEKAAGAFSVECDKTFKGYIHAVGFYKLKRSALWMIPVGIVLGLLGGYFGWGGPFESLDITEGGGGILAALSCAFGAGIAFPIVMLLIRPIIAYTYAIILCPIGYPLYLFIRHLLDKRLDARLGRIFLVYEEKYKEKRHMIECEFRNKEKELTDEVNAYRDAFGARMDERAQLFAQSPLTDKISDWLFSCFKDRYEGADRSAEAKDICISFFFTVYFGRVSILKKDNQHSALSFDFSENRFPEMVDCCEQMALCDILATRLESAIKEMLASEQSASVTVSRSVNDSCYPLSEASAEFFFTAPNPNYEPLKSW